jgi:hypothetical protein
MDIIAIDLYKSLDLVDRILEANYTAKLLNKLYA